MIIAQRDLEPEDQEELGLIPHRSEPDLCEKALEWVETAAYYQWLDEGCPDNRSIEHWHRAYKLFHEIHGK